MEEKFEGLIQKFESENIKYEIKKYPEGGSRVIFNLPSARDFRQCIFAPTKKYLDVATDSSFEKFKFLDGYEGIWSSDLNIIEVEVQAINGPNEYVIKRLKTLVDGMDYGEDDEVFLSEIGDVKISLGFNSQEFSFLSESKSSTLNLLFPRKGLTLKVSNIDIKEHDKAKEFIERVSNSVFFQIDLRYNIPFILKSERENFFDRVERMGYKEPEKCRISEIKYDYEKEPMSLYWHAKELRFMPLFQYLAFYQVVEFYFPVYSSYEAKQRIQNLIKDPRFDPNKDSDITKIISTIKVSSNGNAYGSEREQLKATLNGCVDNSELREFLLLDTRSHDFFNEQKKCFKISKQKLSINSDKADLLNEVAERVYDIRCKIVHSKVSGNSSDVLLPFSDEVKNLRFDVSIIEFIARKVLIANSRPLKV